MRSASSGRRRAANVARVAQAAGPHARKSASSDRITSACSKRYRVTYVAEREPRPGRALSRPADPTDAIWLTGTAEQVANLAASVGELTDSVRIRMPAP